MLTIATIVNVAVTLGVWLLLAVAVLVIVPLFRSVCVTMWLPVQVTLVPGARVAGVPGLHVRLLPNIGSVTVTPVRVTVPLLVATMVYPMTWPVGGWWAGWGQLGLEQSGG